MESQSADSKIQMKQRIEQHPKSCKQPSSKVDDVKTLPKINKNSVSSLSSPKINQNSQIILQPQFSNLLNNLKSKNSRKYDFLKSIHKNDLQILLSYYKIPIEIINKNYSCSIKDDIRSKDNRKIQYYALYLSSIKLNQFHYTSLETIKWNQIIILDLSGCGIVDSSFKAFINFQNNFMSLMELVIIYNSITTDGFEYFCQKINKYKFLRKVFFDNNSITQSLVSLKKITSSTIRLVSLKFNPMTKQEMLAIIEQNLQLKKKKINRNYDIHESLQSIQNKNQIWSNPNTMVKSQEIAKINNINEDFQKQILSQDMLKHKNSNDLLITGNKIILNLDYNYINVRNEKRQRKKSREIFIQQEIVCDLQKQQEQQEQQEQIYVE